MSPWRIALLVALHAVPVFYLLHGGLTPLDALLLSWAEGLIAISLNRIRLAAGQLRSQTWRSGLRGTNRRKRRRGRRRSVLGELTRSLIGGLLLYGLLGLFAFGAIFIMSGDEGIPWTVGSQTFREAVGWMALAAAADAAVSFARGVPDGSTGALFDRRTIAMLLRFVADYVLLVFGALLIVGYGIPTAAVVALIATKLAIDIAAESWSNWLDRQQPAKPADDQPR